MKARALLALALALGTLSARADPADELARLRSEAAALRQSLDALDAKIEALENAHAGAPRKKTPAEPSPVSVHRGWSQVRPGVSKDEVANLLGKPEREMRLNGDLVWYYVYPGLGRGSVFFNGADKVTATQAPHAGWFE